MSLKNLAHLFRPLVYVPMPLLMMYRGTLKTHEQIPETLTAGFSLAYSEVQLAAITRSKSIRNKVKAATANNCFLAARSNDLRLKFGLAQSSCRTAALFITYTVYLYVCVCSVWLNKLVNKKKTPLARVQLQFNSALNPIQEHDL